jgi:hypothetical protein
MRYLGKILLGHVFSHHGVIYWSVHIVCQLLGLELLMHRIG